MTARHAHPHAPEYHVRVLPEEHTLDVELLFTRHGDAPLELAVPTWVPGAYGFMKYGRDVYDVRATDAETGEHLAVTRHGWSSFLVAGPSKRVRVTWRATMSDAAWGELAGIVDDRFAVLLATRYLHVVGHEGPCRVRYHVPTAWPLHHPSGAHAVSSEASEQTWEYPSFAALLDTPVVLGSFVQRTRTHADVPFHHVFVGDAVGFDTEVDAFVDDVMKIVKECESVFGAFPFADYTFVFGCDPRFHWGLEHANGTMIGLSPDTFIDPKERLAALRVSAHELVHAWNVCRLKPRGLDHLDHEHGSFTDGLWVSEGFTRYYEFLLLVRAGLMSPERFLSNLGCYYRALTSLPAFAHATLADSSRATFLNHNRYPGSVNSTIDYYDKGMLVAFDLDAALRFHETPSTLDREFRAFYEAYVGKKGFTTDDVRTFFSREAKEVDGLLEREVLSAGQLSTLEWLTKLGFEVEMSSRRVLGVVLKEGVGPRIGNVLEGGPAARVGLAPDDDIERVDGFPFTAKRLAWLTAREDEIEVDVARGHARRTYHVRPTPTQLPVALVFRGGSQEIGRLRAWLGLPDLTFQAGHAIPLEAYDNFHGTDAVV